MDLRVEKMMEKGGMFEIFQESGPPRKDILGMLLEIGCIISTSGGRPVTEEEIRAVLMQKSPITTRDLVNNFPGRLKTKEKKDAFAAILRLMSRIQKTEGINYVVLREK